MSRSKTMKFRVFLAVSGLSFLQIPVLQATDAPVTTSGSPSSLTLSSGYSKVALPILKQSCFACHGPQAQASDKLPPDLRKKAVKAVTKAQNQFPMADTYPFPGGGDPKDDLKDFSKSLKKGWMPPESQKILNLGQPLSDSDRKILLKWAAKTLKALK